MGKHEKVAEGICQMCGKKYKTSKPNRAKFCSNICGSRHWRRVKWYQEGRITPIIMRNKNNTKKNENQTSNCN